MPDMSKGRFPFAYKKATQALNFLAQQAGGKLDKLKALKLVFYADRYHLRKYGRLVTNDAYWAMEYGPVPSGTKELVEMSAYLGRQEREYVEKHLTPAKDEHFFKSKTNVNEGVFSASDLEALRFAWEKFGGKSGVALFKLTHRYPEWKRHEKAFQRKEVSRIPISYEDFLEEAEAGLEPCFELTAQDREDRREALKQSLAFESKWN
jgi:uncharacterized phage-associated protein